MASDEASASVKPCEGALDDPAAWQDDEVPDVGTPDDLDGKLVEMRDGGLQLLAGIAAIGGEAAQRGISIPAV